MAQVYVRPFVPKPPNGLNTVNVAVGAANQSLALGTNKGQGFQSIRLVNSGTQTIFLNFSQAAGTAALATDLPMLPGTAEVFGLHPDIAFINVIATGVGSTLYATIGEGV